MNAATAWLRDRFTTEHWLDDPVTTNGLFLVGAAIQAWSTYFMWSLATWAYEDGSSTGLINVLFYDFLGLLALRLALDTRHSSPIRQVAGWTAGFCVAFTFAGNIAAHWILDHAGKMIPRYAPVMADWQAPIRVTLGSVVVVLAVVITALASMTASRQVRVKAEEARQAGRDRERTQRDEERAVAAEQARQAAADAEAAEQARWEREQETRRQEAAAAEAAARLELERVAAQRAADELARVEAEAGAAQRTADLLPSDTQPIPAVPAGAVDELPELDLAQRYPAHDGEKMMDRAKRIARAEFRAGRDVKGPVIDRAIGAGESTGRKAIRAVVVEGAVRPGSRPELVAS